MTGTAIEPFQPDQFPELLKFAEGISRSNLLPSAYRGKPADVAVAVMWGQEVGLSPMAALTRIVVVNGKATLDAQGMVAVVRRAGHSISGTSSSTKATVTGKRSDTGDELTVEWTMDDAKRARLDGKDVWKQFPSDMLWARAVSAVCRRLFADVCAGLTYTEEEMEGVPSESRSNSRRAPAAKPANVDGETGEVIEDAEVVEEAAPAEQAKSRRRKPPTAKTPAPAGNEASDGHDAGNPGEEAADPTSPSAASEPGKRSAKGEARQAEHDLQKARMELINETSKLDGGIRQVINDNWRKENLPLPREIPADRLDECREKVAKWTAEVYLTRQKRANVEMGKIGVTEDDDRHALVREATGGETESTGRLTDVQLTAVVQECIARGSEGEAS